MTTRAMGPMAGFHWLKQAINLGGANPRAIIGAAALLMVVALVPTVLQLLLQNVMGITSQGVAFALVGFSLLYSLLVMPPLTAGYLRIIHATETGAPTRAGAIFDAFQAGSGAPRVIGLVLLLLVLGIAMFGVIAAVFGGDFFLEIAAMMTAMETAAPGATPELPQLPSGFGTLMAVLFVVGLFFNGVYAISIGQVALTGRSVGGAFADGILGALKNLLPLLVLLLVGIVAGLIVILVLVLVVGLLMMLGSLVHPALGVALAAPVYLGAMVLLYVVMFGVMYFMWRDVCADGTPAQDGNDRDHQVAA